MEIEFAFAAGVFDQVKFGRMMLVFVALSQLSFPDQVVSFTQEFRATGSVGVKLNISEELYEKVFKVYNFKGQLEDIFAVFPRNRVEQQ